MTDDQIDERVEQCRECAEGEGWDLDCDEAREVYEERRAELREERAEEIYEMADEGTIAPEDAQILGSDPTLATHWNMRDLAERFGCLAELESLIEDRS